MDIDLLITNALIFPSPGSPNLIRSGFLSIRDSRIQSLGEMTELPSLNSAKTVDAKGCLAMPGLINTHCHAPMTLFRGLADDLDLPTWLNQHIFPAEAAHVDPEMVYWCSLLAAAEMILSGTTLVADGYFHEHEVAKAFFAAGLRAVPAHGVIDFPAPGVSDPTRNILAAAEFIDHWQNRDPLITPAVFAHSPYTCRPQTLQGAKELARSRNTLFFVHLAESRHEQNMIIAPQADTPVKHLEALNLLDEKTVCVHSVWLDDQDLDIIARHGAKIASCAQSNLKLASGIAQLKNMQQRSISIGLGTDGCASNNSLDMFREMDLCAKAQKISDRDPVAVTASSILHMATQGGVDVLGLEADGGCLTPGKLADLILIDIDRPHLQPFHSPELLVYSGSGADVQTVIINGKVVMENRTILTIDLEEIMIRVRILAKKLR